MKKLLLATFSMLSLNTVYAEHGNWRNRSEDTNRSQRWNGNFRHGDARYNKTHEEMGKRHEREKETLGQRHENEKNRLEEKHSSEKERMERRHDRERNAHDNNSNKGEVSTQL